MKIIIHDLSQQEFAEIYPNSDKTVVISDNGKIHNCIGCYGCWIKTPGICVLKDGYCNMGEMLSKCSELVIISKCVYGSYSPFVRNILDRSIPYLLPYFVSRNGETHHKNRYENAFSFLTHFYGDDITQREKETARALTAANGINFYASEINTYFYKGIQEIGGVL